MRRILFDQNTPAGLRGFLAHDVSTAYEMGRSGLANGKLLAAAESAGFEVMVTCDQGIRHRQKLRGLGLGLVILTTNKLRILVVHAAMVAEAVERVRRGGCEVVAFPRQPARR